jgi:hypothetical protein
MSFTISTLKRCLVRLDHQLFVVWLMSYLCYLWLLVYSGVQCVLHIWITRRMSYKKQGLLTLRWHQGSLPAFGGFCAAHLFRFLCCVLCFVYLRSVSCLSKCCQFLWIVHSWFPLRFSLTFILYVMYACLMISSFYMSLISSIMVNVLAASTVLDHGFESRSVQTKVFYNWYLLFPR